MSQGSKLIHFDDPDLITIKYCWQLESKGTKITNYNEPDLITININKFYDGFLLWKTRELWGYTAKYKDLKPLKNRELQIREIQIRELWGLPVLGTQILADQTTEVLSFALDFNVFDSVLPKLI